MPFAALNPSTSILLHTNFRPHEIADVQHSYMEAEAGSTLVEFYAPFFVPGPLQVSEYARTRFREATQALDMPMEEEAVTGRMARAAGAADVRRKIHVVFDEWALTGAAASRDVMFTQLHHLKNLMQLPHIRIGVIPRGTRHMPLMAHVDIHSAGDRNSVYVETLGHSLLTKDPVQVALYGREFDTLSDMAAVYGEDARRLVDEAIENLC